MSPLICKWDGINGEPESCGCEHSLFDGTSCSRDLKFFCFISLLPYVTVLPSKFAFRGIGSDLYPGGVSFVSTFSGCHYSVVESQREIMGNCEIV